MSVEPGMMISWPLQGQEMTALVDPAFGSRGGFDPGEVIVNSCHRATSEKGIEEAQVRREV